MTNEQIAQKVYEAYETGQLAEDIPAELRVKTMEEAYVVQQMCVKQKLEKLGEKIIGAKVGATNKKLLAANNLVYPFFAPLTEQDLFTSNLSLSEKPGLTLVELEILFRFTKDVSPEADEKEIIENSEITLAVEVPTRRTKSPGSIVDTTCDIGYAGHVMYFDKFIPTLSLEEMAQFKGRVYLNDEVIVQGTSADVYGNPIHTVLYANQMMNQLYGSFKKGMIVMSGSLTAPQPIQKGRYRLVIDGLGEATLNVEE